MQRFLLKMSLSALLLVVLCSLSAKAGGDYYRIFLNNKLLLERHATEPLNLGDLPLPNAASGDKLVVYFSHCGDVGKSRVLTVRDAAGKVVKQWKYADTEEKKAGMSIPVDELLALKKANGGVLNLHYAAAQLPGGMMLAGINGNVRSAESAVRALPAGKGKRG